MHQDYDNMPSELISVAELWQEEINKITHALEYLKQRVKEEMQGIPPKTSPREKRTLH